MQRCKLYTSKLFFFEIMLATEFFLFTTVINIICEQTGYRHRFSSIKIKEWIGGTGNFWEKKHKKMLQFTVSFYCSRVI